MKTLRPYQIDLATKGAEMINRLKLCYVASEVRTGKTATVLEIAKLTESKKVLFLTKKKAISSILSDYNDFGYKFELVIINNESMHTIECNDFDLIISDEHHRNGAFPKPNKFTKDIKKRFSKIPMVFLSGTPTPENHAQWFHQFWVSIYTPFQAPTFYKWASAGYVNVKLKNAGYAQVRDYSELTEKGMQAIQRLKDNYVLAFTQKEAGFTTEVKEMIFEVDMKPITHTIANKLKKDAIFQGRCNVIIADTGAKLMSKLHQLYSGTCILETGEYVVTDNSKALFIKDRFQGKKIAIFYKFQAEFDMLKNTFGENLTNDLDEFNSTSKNIALQIVAGREGISLKQADCLVYLNIDFSAVSYWQSRDRLTTMERTVNDVFWIFSKGGIERKIHKAVMNKKNYTLSIFKKDGIKISN